MSCYWANKIEELQEFSNIERLFYFFYLRTGLINLFTKYTEYCFVILEIICCIEEN